MEAFYYSVKTQTKRQKEKCIEGSICEFRSYNNALEVAISDSKREVMHDVIIEGYDIAGDRIFHGRVKNGELINLIGAN